MASSDIAFIGEAPGANEVKEEEPFVGQSGVLLNHVVDSIEEGLEYTKMNVVGCRPPGNRTPSEDAISRCSGRLTNELIDSGAKTVVAMGATAADFFTEPGMKISQRRGLWFIFGGGLDVLCTWHPAYVLRRPGEMHTFMADITKALRGNTNVEIMQAPQIVIPRNVDELIEELNEVPSGASVVFDLETDQLRWYPKENQGPNRIMMIGLAWEGDRAIIINHDLIYGTDSDIGYFNRDNAFFVDQREYMEDCFYGWDTIQDFFSRKDLSFVAHNGKFDALWLKSVGIEARVDFDTMLAHYVLHEISGTHGLKRLAVDYLGLHDYEGVLIQKYLKNRNDYYSKVPMTQLAVYCGWDVCVTLALAKMFKKMLKDENLLVHPFLSPIMEASAAFVEMEFKGIRVDHTYLVEWQDRIDEYLVHIEGEMGDTVSTYLEGVSDERRATLFQEANRTVKSVTALLDGEKDFNPRSPWMMSFALYNMMRFPRPKSRRIKNTSTSKDAITNILDRFPQLKKNPFIDQLMKYRRAHKMQRSYVVNLLKNADQNRDIHPTFLIHGTEVGRLSARDPAVQTIPRPHQDIFGAIIRSAFIARPGHVFIDADYSQAELRVAACLSGDEFLMDVYANDRDLHTEVSVEMYGEDFTYEDRMLCKMFNFSYLYGGNEYSFAQDAGLPIETARQFVGNYNEVMSKLAQYKAAQFELARTQGYVESVFGRRRRFPLITRDNVKEVKKACVHMPIASAASDIDLLALIKLINEGFRVVLPVHDSLIVEVPIGDAEADADYIKEVMEDTASKVFPQIPWKVDTDIVKRWAPLPLMVNDEVFETLGGKSPMILDMENLTGIPEIDMTLTEFGKVQLWDMQVS